MRENEMIKNICRASEGLSYEKAVFLTGAQHLETFEKKIRNIQENDCVNIEWDFNYFEKQH